MQLQKGPGDPLMGRLRGQMAVAASSSLEFMESQVGVVGWFCFPSLILFSELWKSVRFSDREVWTIRNSPDFPLAPP
jgi:hypothetical protein